MIEKYFFEICDENDNDILYDIDGEEYKKFIDVCFKNCKYFSLDFRKTDVSLADEIAHCEYSFQISDDIKRTWYKDYQVVLPDFIKDEYVKAFHKEYWARKYYICNEETKKFLLDFGSVFEYIWEYADKNQNCPENLMFYREDDKVLILIVTHEGVCYLYKHSDDNLDDIIKNPQWRKSKQ